mmetsp:Transcript_112488/g.359238  ORF Transcript_112488/g.359238 Transcript_112488/m.359238 type:complete len:235 (+) Transcript_112488:189-893(+)
MGQSSTPSKKREKLLAHISIAWPMPLGRGPARSCRACSIQLRTRGCGIPGIFSGSSAVATRRGKASGSCTHSSAWSSSRRSCRTSCFALRTVEASTPPSRSRWASKSRPEAAASACTRWGAKLSATSRSTRSRSRLRGSASQKARTAPGIAWSARSSARAARATAPKSEVGISGSERGTSARRKRSLEPGTPARRWQVSTWHTSWRKLCISVAPLCKAGARSCGQSCPPWMRTN